MQKIKEIRENRRREASFRRSAGGWKGLVDGDALIKRIYEDRLRPGRRFLPSEPK